MTKLAEQFRFDLSQPTHVQLPLRYNIAPTQAVAAVRRSASTGERELAMLHWGLVPAWSKDAKMAGAMINARAETVAEKPAFRSAFASRRCLVLADGYFEWKKVGKTKQPYYIRLRDERPFAFAGLWEAWRPLGSLEGAPFESCTIVTTSANDLTAPLHERMPVILEPVDYDLWLDPAVTDRTRLEPLLATYPSVAMKVEPVDPRVNNVRNDDPGCVEVQTSTLPVQSSFLPGLEL